MNISITGKHIDLGDSFRARVGDALSSAIAKYFPKPLDAHVTVSREGVGFRVEITVHAARNLRMEAAASLDDIHGAADQAIERIAKRLRRHKRRLIRHHHHAPVIESAPARSYVVDPEPAELADEVEGAGDQPVIVAEMATEVLTLGVGEAVMRLDLSEQPVLVFRNSAHGGVNVVYRRADGHVGWVDPGHRAAGAG
jgi:ribosomal subunit interface protein